MSKEKQLADKAEWVRRIKEAKASNQRLIQFMEKWKINSGGAWATIKKIIDDEELTAWPKGATPGRRGPYVGKQKSAAPVNYQKIELLPEYAPAPSQKPVFCLMVMYESREAAMRAMGMLQ